MSIPEYRKNIRPDDTIFVTFPPCKPLNNSTLNKALNQIWKLVFGKDAQISATLLRKSIVTNVRRRCPTSRDALAAHMSHNPRTADIFYNVVLASDNALDMACFINEAMTGSNIGLNGKSHTQSFK